MSHIFISYSQDDADFADVLLTRLEKAGFGTWLDKERLRAGVDWSEEIDEGIRKASVVLLVLSPSSRASEYVTYEWSCAIGAGVRVVPILLRQTEVHPRLSRLHYLDFSGKVRPWDKLIEELQSIKNESHPQWKPPRDAPPYVHRAVADLDSANSDTRHGAVDAITRWKHSEVGLALQLALTMPFRGVRARAAIALAEMDDPAATTESGLSALTDALVPDFDGGPDSDSAHRARQIASRATSALLKIGRPALDHLTQVAKSTTHPSRTAATNLLGEVGGADAIPILLELMEDADRRLVMVAIEQLGLLKAKKAVPGILRCMIENAEASYIRESRGGNMREAAVRALVEIGDRSIEPQLVAATKHRVPTVRMSAAEVLGKLCGASAIPVVAGLLSDLETAAYLYAYDDGSAAGGRPTVAAVAAQALDRIGTPEAVDLVLQYRREHPPDGKWPALSVDPRKAPPQATLVRRQ